MPLGGDELNSGYKGYGLGLVAELFTGLMAGSKYAHHVRAWTGGDSVADLGHCLAAIDPEAFCPGLPERMQELMDHLRKLEPADSTKPVLVPGDPERIQVKHVDIVQKGCIFYTPNHITTYKALAKQLDIEPMRPQHGILG